ncbi:MAG: hypothetical protein GY832_14705 [Chloroflexi bacterium]|nr:hypothetical protein [Chloroflexota bacterium]
MKKYTNESTSSPTPSMQQDWGQTIGTGITVLVVIVIVVNLFTYEPAANNSPYAKVNIPAHWIQIGRWISLLVGLGGCGWLLRQMFRQRQTVERTSLTPLLQQAIGYTHRIEELLQANPNKHQQQLLAQIRTWQQTIQVMVQTLTDLGQNDHIIQRDLYHLPGMIADLEMQLATENLSILRTDLEQMLHQRKNQQQALEQLQTTRRRAAIQIERTTAVLGTIYSQLLTYRSTFHITDYQRLGDNVSKEVHRLQDYLETLHELAF